MAEYTVHAKKSLIIKAAISKSKIHVSEKKMDEVHGPSIKDPVHKDPDI